MIPVQAPSRKHHGESVNLNEVLHRFSTKPEWLAAERQTLPQAPRAQLEVLLREISETVLPRCIELRAQGRQIATLTVSNRRLYAIEWAGNDNAGNTKPDARQLAEQLLDLSKRATALTTRAIADPSLIAETGDSCSVAALRAALVIDDRTCDITHLADLLEPTAIAHMTWSGDPEKHVLSGAQTWHALMQSHVKRLTDQLSGSKNSKFNAAQETTGVAIPLSDAEVIIIACKDALGVASVAPIKDGLKAISTWQISDT